MSRKLPVLSPYIYPFFIGCVWVISFLEVCNPRHLCPLRHRSSDAFLDGLHQGPSREGLFFLFSVLLLIQICEKLFMKSKMNQWSIQYKFVIRAFLALVLRTLSCEQTQEEESSKKMTHPRDHHHRRHIYIVLLLVRSASPWRSEFGRKDGYL